MYKNCFVSNYNENGKKPYGYYDVHLWGDDGYSVEEFHNFAYEECSEHQAQYRGLIKNIQIGRTEKKLCLCLLKH